MKTLYEIVSIANGINKEDGKAVSFKEMKQFASKDFKVLEDFFTDKALCLCLDYDNEKDVDKKAEIKKAISRMISCYADVSRNATIALINTKPIEDRYKAYAELWLSVPTIKFKAGREQKNGDFKPSSIYATDGKNRPYCCELEYYDFLCNCLDKSATERREFERKVHYFAYNVMQNMGVEMDGMTFATSDIFWKRFADESGMFLEQASNNALKTQFNETIAPMFFKCDGIKIPQIKGGYIRNLNTFLFPPKMKNGALVRSYVGDNLNKTNKAVNTVWYFVHSVIINRPIDVTMNMITNMKKFYEESVPVAVDSEDGNHDIVDRPATEATDTTVKTAPATGKKYKVVGAPATAPATAKKATAKKATATAKKATATAPATAKK